MDANVPLSTFYTFPTDLPRATVTFAKLTSTSYVRLFSVFISRSIRRKKERTSLFVCNNGGSAFLEKEKGHKYMFRVPQAKTEGSFKSLALEETPFFSDYEKCNRQKPCNICLTREVPSRCHYTDETE